MNKRYISLLMMVAIVFGAMLTVNAQESSAKYKMWEDIMLTPDNNHPQNIRGEYEKTQSEIS